MMDSEKILQSGILEQYVLGLVSDEESAEIEVYMVAFPEVNEKVQRLRSCMEHYTGLHDISSPKKSNLSAVECNELSDKARKHCLSVETKFGQPQQKEQLAEMQNHTRLLTGLASISIIFFAGLSIYFYQKQASETAALTEVQRELLALKKEYQMMVSQTKITTPDNSFLKDETTRKMNMKGVGVMPEAEVIVYYNPKEKRTVLDPVSLPEAPKDHHYQLWAAVGQRNVDMGKINQGRKKNRLIPIDFVANADDFTITLKSNADQPSEKGDTCLVVYR